MVQEWTDYNLAWNESEYGGIPSVRIPPSHIWKPDIFMYNRLLIVSITVLCLEKKWQEVFHLHDLTKLESIFIVLPRYILKSERLVCQKNYENSGSCLFKLWKINATVPLSATQQ